MTNPLPQNVNPVPKVLWTGISGTTYEFEHFKIGAVTFNAVAGIYIFCHQASDNRWYAVYIGETDNFRRRLADELPSHHALNDISRAGATHICAMVVAGGNAERVRIETDLRHRLNPTCNRQ
jgi:hypothetical protein